MTANSMTRRVFAFALIAHGLAHASAGMWATDIGGHGLATILWEGSAVGFISAGAGLLGISFLLRRWRTLVTIAALSSLILLLAFSHPLFIAGIVADFTALAVAIWTYRPRTWDDTRPMSRVPRAILSAFILYVAIVIGLRDWHSSWGSTRSEQLMPLIGDPPLGESHYRIDHAVTINAPVDSAWKWLIQIGQDRAGFYSYDWLERLFGANVHNSDVVVDKWQQRAVGDLVRAAQPGYLGGLLGENIGWRVSDIEPGRAIVLKGWGAFVLTPIDGAHTRLHIRTRGKGVPTLSGVALTPLSLLIFEPAHFIMERGMMLGLKRRAEGRIRVVPAGV
jgi:hypothetical protein